MLLINTEDVIQHKSTYSLLEYTETEGKERWCEVLDKSIREIVKEDDERIGLPLSSGYDSNYILHVIRQYTDKEVIALSIGGLRGKNEISNIEKIIPNYKNIHHCVDYTDDDLLKVYPDIIWRMEGSVFELGIFLKYVLARLAWKQHLNYIICGDCANEIMCGSHYIINNCKNSNDGKLHIENCLAHDEPFYNGLMKFHKKAGILMNSFDIDPYFPHLDENFIGITKSVKHLSGETKEFHKKVCCEKIPSNVTQHIGNIGGDTDAHSILTKERFEKLNKYLSETNIWIQLNSNFTRSEGLLMGGYYENLKRRLIVTPKYVFTFAIKNQLYKYNNLKYLYEERKMLNTLGYLYLELFNQLFISGKYDQYFNEESFNVSISDVLEIKL